MASPYDRQQIFRSSSAVSLRYSPTLAAELHTRFQALAQPRPSAEKAAILLLQLEFLAAVHGVIDGDMARVKRSIRDLESEIGFPRTTIARLLSGLKKIGLIQSSSSKGEQTLNLREISSLKSLTMRYTLPALLAEELRDEAAEADVEVAASERPTVGQLSYPATCPTVGQNLTTVGHQDNHSGTKSDHCGTVACTDRARALEREIVPEEKGECVPQNDLKLEATRDTHTTSQSFKSIGSKRSTNTLSEREKTLLAALLEGNGDALRAESGALAGARQTQYEQCAVYLARIGADFDQVARFFVFFPKFMANRMQRPEASIDRPRPLQISEMFEEVLGFANRLETELNATALNATALNADGTMEMYRNDVSANAHSNIRPSARQPAAERNRDNFAKLLSVTASLRSSLDYMGNADADDRALPAAGEHARSPRG